MREAPASAAPMKTAAAKPWFDGSDPGHKGPVTVLGAGLAGCATARALAERGCQVTLMDRAPAPATAASGNPAAVVLPLPALESSPLSRFFLHAYNHTLQTIQEFEANGKDLGWRQLGVIHLPARRKVVKQIARLAATDYPKDVARVIDAADARQRCGLNIQSDVLWYERGGALNPAALCAAWLDHPGIATHWQADIASIHWQVGWQLRDHAGQTRHSCERLVLANGHNMNQWQPTAWLPLAVSGGRLITVPGRWCQPTPQTIICHKGYAIPLANGRLLLGATWHEADSNPLPDPDAQQALLNEARQWLPGFEPGDSQAIFERFAHRAKTDDHLPIAGPAPLAEHFLAHFSELHHGQPAQTYPSGRYWPGLYLCGGLGARGVVASGLAAEVCAASITGTTNPLPLALVEAIHPSRFLIRDLKRKPVDRRIEYTH